ncbi:MAG: helix-turn-helix domain-containing protein [Ignavibacteriaceae bacterium]
MTCSIEDDAMSYLMSYDYPGNIRELRLIVNSALNLTEGRCISAAVLPETVRRAKKISAVDKDSASEPFTSLELMEKNHILKVYRQTGRNKSKTAEILGVNRKTLQRKLKSYGVE